MASAAEQLAANINFAAFAKATDLQKRIWFTLIALVVYEKVGLAILRRAWFNLDRVWAGALVAAGALTLVF